MKISPNSLSRGHTQKLSLNDLSPLLLIPSFYGTVLWAVMFMWYKYRLLPYHDDKIDTLCMFFFVAICFATSLMFSIPRFKKAVHGNRIETSHFRTIQTWNSSTALMILLFHSIGFLGAIVYIRDFGASFGGIMAFFDTFTSRSYEIRWMAEEQSSVGTQLSYFGWVAIAWSYAAYRLKLVPKGFLLVALVQFVMNFLWIDRTRPLTIFFHLWLAHVVTARKLTLTMIVRNATVAMAAILTLFITLALWIGKLHSTGNVGEDSELWIENIYIYATSGFAYFNDVVANPDRVSRPAGASYYPLAKALSAFGMVSAPPSPIKPFREVPCPTNIGTFLLPFAEDGGLGLALVGALIQSFVMDYVSLLALRSRSIFANIAVSTACWSSAMAFFTPKIASTESWLFLIIGAVAVAYSGMAERRRIRSRARMHSKQLVTRRSQLASTVIGKAG